MRKQLFLILMLICTLCPNLYAAPALQKFVEIVQPDGSIIKARQQGDEFQRWTETRSGHTILRNPKTKYWDYARQDANGKLKASGYRAMEQGLAPPHIPPRLKPPRNKALEQYKKKSLARTYQERLQRAPSSSPSFSSSFAPSAPPVRRAAAGDWSPVAVAGERKLLVVLINFSDRILQTTPADWEATVFSPTGKSVARYYAENSFSSFGISPAAHSQPGSPAGIVTVSIAAPHPYLDGDNDPDENYATEPALINLALAQAAAVVNFSAFDTNSNATLENSELTIYFIYAGYEASGSNNKPSVWAHAWGDGGVMAGDLNVTDWALGGELNDDDRQQGMGIIAHELGHALCGLPDLYDTSYTNAGMGIFSLMATGLWGGDSGEDDGTTPTNLDLWSREYLGWATPAEPGADGSVAISSALFAPDSGYKLRTPLSESEYFLLENRHPSGWDLGTKNDLGAGWQGGLLLTHIDISAGTVGANDINDFTATGGRQGVSPMQANKESCDMALEASCWGDAKTLYYQGNNVAWTPLTAPDSSYYDGTPTDFSLTAISPPGETMTAEWSTIPIVLPPVIDDFENGNLEKLPWLTSGNDNWAVTASGYDSTYAAEAPASLSDNQNATLQTTVVTGDGTLTFRYKVDSEVNYDSLTFSVDGIEQGRWSGLVNWARLVYPLTAGTHTFTWKYKKDGSISSGLDSAWIDDLSFPARYELSALRAGNGSGNVIPDVGTLTWAGDTGAAIYDNGTVVTLTATAAPDSTFTGWEGACSDSGACGVTMDAAKEIVAKFVITATIPTITAFTLPAMSNNLSVAISLSASDTIGVTGYCLTETNSSNGCDWSASVPASYTFTTAGSKTLYAFARDVEGNISTSINATTTIDTSAPIVTAFTLPATGNNLSVTISNFGASDNIGVTGYCLAETDNSSGCVWSTLAPASYPFASAGDKSLYAFVKDAVGNISGSVSASTTIDISAPTVTVFTLPATTGNRLSVAISSFGASDNIGVTGYCLVETNNSNTCIWSDATPASFLFASDGNKTLYAFVKDAAGNISASHSAGTSLDTTPPTITAFALPTTGNSLSVAISSLTASDASSVTGYCLTAVNDSSACTWDSTAPTNYLFATNGNQTLYAFARDAVGNISTSASASTTIDTTAPTVTAFTLPTTGNSLIVTLGSFSASDNIAITGYCLTETNDSSSCDWSTSLPTSYLFTSDGNQTLYAFVRDAAGNNSGRASASTAIDTSAPTVTAFILPMTGNNLTVPVSSLSANDNVSVTGYCLTETNNSNGCTWSASAPTSYIFADAGSKTLFVFVKDAVGNISPSVSASSTVDITAPFVTVFTLPAMSSSLSVTLNSFTASDNVAVSDYCLTETNNSSSCTWDSTTPTSYIFPTAGSKTLYAFVRDAVGNSSASASASTSIDTIAPIVTIFTLPATGSNLTVPVSSLTASDNVSVSGYCLTETNDSGSCSWSASAPASYSFTSAGDQTLYAFTRDAAGNISASRSASTTIDTTTPTVTAFTLPATSNSLTVPVSSLIASDNDAVSGYCLAETNTSSSCDWSTSAPGSYLFANAGNQTLYAFARDAVGNISGSASASTTIDTIAPTVTAFILPATSNSLTVPVSSLSASDNVSVTGYCLTETNNSSSCSWSASTPTSYLFASDENQTLYAFARDAAGNISGSASAGTTIDTSAPTVTAFILPATGNSLTVAVSSLVASDNVSVTGYCLTETNDSSSCSWSASAPTCYLFASAGNQTLYAFTQDAVGNISDSSSASTTIDTTAPIVTVFILPATGNSLTVPLSNLIASDNVAVSGYCLTETNNSSSCTWDSTTPTSYIFATAGNQSLYAFVRDAAGNISGSASSSTMIDTTAPTVTAFALPAASSSLTVPVSTLIANDNVSVTGYCLTATNANSSCSWSASAPTSYLFTSAGIQTLYAFTQDAVGNISGSSSASTTIDTITPTVTSFTLPATGNSLTVPVSSLIASDNDAVTGYCLTEMNNSNSCSWNAAVPTSYHFLNDGNKSLYAFTQDAAGNISAGVSASTSITLLDTTAPNVTAFTLPMTGSSQSVPVSSFSASDNIAVSGYCLTETNNSSSCSWSASAPPSYLFTSTGEKILYAFAQDAAGNISANRSASTTIMDITAPIVAVLTLPAMNSSLNVIISGFSASDNVAVSGYCLTETNNSSSCSWNATLPTSYLFTSAGNQTLYAFARDAAGNISGSSSASTTIDIAAPSVTAFTLPATGNSLSVIISGFSASDDGAVSGYCLTETNNNSSCSWNATAPASHLFTSAGNQTLYAFAKDAAGNISGSVSANTMIDIAAPSVTAFTLPATGSSLSVTLSDFSASDNVAVSGYCLTETNNSSSCLWDSTAPTSYIFTTAGNQTLYAFAKDTAGNISGSVSASTAIDITAPTISVFTLPATSSSLSVILSGFSASDNIAVSGYCLTETNNSSSCSWSALAPSSYLFASAGSKVLYAFARDAVGNISGSASASTTIDTTAPTVTAFTLPTTGNNLSVALNFIASDTDSVTGYCLTTTNNSSSCSWSASVPTSYLFASAGNKVLYAFARDAVGNISDSVSASTTIDTITPTVAFFTLPATGNSLTVPVSSLIASDNDAVTGYCLTEMNNSSSCSWSASTPASYLFVSAGNQTLYAFVRDAAGNISSSSSASTTIDIVAPTVTTFNLPTAGSSLSIAVSSLIANDNVAVTGYCLTETNNSSSCLWDSTTPTSYNFTTDGNQSLYAFVRDAAGNISGSASTSTTIDIIAPTVTTFSLPVTSGNRDVAISFSASDAASVTGYCLTETDSSSACVWSASAPTSYLFASDGSKFLYAFARDAAGNISASRSTTTTIDTTAPAVTAFTLPVSSSSLSVPVNSFSASDSGGVTGYCLTENNNKSGCSWSAAAPGSYTFTTAGYKSLFAFAKDAVGNISASRSASTTIDTTAPTMTAFTLPATGNSLNVTLGSFSASDNIAISGYCLAEINNSNSCSWGAAPASYDFASAGEKTLYAFARDAAGNISVSASASTSIDNTVPTVTAFTLPATGNSLNVTLGSFSASDNIAVTGYCLTETNNNSSCSWSTSVPTSYLFTSAGNKTLYAFIRDAVGNISTNVSASSSIDTTAPTVTAFALPAAGSSLSVAVSSLIVNDNVAVTGYCLTETNNSSSCLWDSTAPTSFIFTTAGSKNLYAFARDAAGNISGSASASTSIDNTVPTVTAFALPSTGNSQSITLSSFSASDNVAVTGYCLTETDNSSSCTWSAAAPTSYLFTRDGSRILYAFARDADGNISASSSATIMIDITAPQVAAFSLPATNNKLNVPISSFTTADNIGVTGYCLKQSNSSSGCTWNTTAPTFFTFTSAGNKILYAFARDAAGNISASSSATTSIDITAPEFTDFSLAATSNSLTVAINNFTASDNTGVTGYCLNENNDNSDCAWNAAAPSSYTFTTDGNKILYAFVRDAAGNISDSANSSTTIDTTGPAVTAFTLPATSSSLNVAISSFSASDSVGVTGYCLHENNNSSSCSWDATAPTGYSFATAGAKTLYAFARDAAGNISPGASASTTIDTTAPVVTAFTLPATSNSLNVAISSFSASDNVDVTGYCLTETNSSSGCGWSTPAPTSYLFASAGSQTLYVFARDAAGNISAGSSTTTTIDVTAPAVTAFTLATTNNSLTVAISSFSASDNVDVTGYCLTETDNSSSCPWSAAAPTSHLFAGDGNKTLYAFARDAAGNISVSRSASTTIDTTGPTIAAMTLPATSSSLSIVVKITATDTVGVTGYLLSESAAEPRLDDPAWQATPDGTFTFASEGNKTLYAFARDAIGNISARSSANTTIMDTTAPLVTFTLPVMGQRLTLVINNFLASDEFGVTGYCLSESDDSSACLWNDAAPTGYTFTDAGDKTLYAFARDAAGNISVGSSANTTIMDFVAPLVTFTLPATSTSLSVTIDTLTASDDFGVTGYCLSESNDSSSCLWNAPPPTGYTFTNAGDKTLYAFVRDAVGNISVGSSAMITIADITAPNVTFTLPVTSHSLAVTISSLTASDDFGVTGYCLSERNDSSGCTWTVVAPSRYVFAAGGEKTLYAFARDAVGNTSAGNSATTTITDVTAPGVTFSLPPNSTSLSVTISSLTASDEFGMAGYCLSENNDSSSCTWTVVAPSRYLFAAAGEKTLFAFAKDAVGNISAGSSATTTITDITAPGVTLTLPVTSHSLTVTISTFSASDEFGVTGYCLSERNDSSGCLWNDAPPTSDLFATAGNQTLYAFAKDAAGNISASSNASTMIVIDGDLNNDNVTNSFDALLALQMAVGKRTVDMKADLAPFVDNAPAPDGKVNAADAWVILRKAVGHW